MHTGICLARHPALAERMLRSTLRPLALDSCDLFSSTSLHSLLVYTFLTSFPVPGCAQVAHAQAGCDTPYPPPALPQLPVHVLPSTWFDQPKPGSVLTYVIILESSKR